ncbi:MAG: hypothetical protein ACXVLX_21190, partial [Ilumatobacteraceae bacterium]
LDLGDSDGNGGNSDMVPTLDGPEVMLDLGSDVGGPTIVVNSPTANSEVVGATLTVKATITPMAGSTVSSDSVTLIVPGANGSPIDVPMSLTAMPDVYQGSADISAIQTGNTNFFVTAKDTMDRSTAVEVKYIHNRGPQITIISPSSATAKGSTTVDVLVIDPLGHAITSLVAGIRTPADVGSFPVMAGSPQFMTVGGLSGNTGTLHVTITFNFNDPQFKPPLDQAQLLVATATANTGNAGQTVQVQAQKAFTVDNAGPVIKINNPTQGAFVGGVVEIKATITDISGVVESTTQAVFGNDPKNKSVQLFRIPGTDDFHGFFDVRQFGLNYVLPSLSVRADDGLGNHGEVGVDIVVDNTPPRLQLDPPKMRLAQLISGALDCSAEFDPVGDEAANDTDTIPQVVTLRARVEDDGNWAPGLNVVRYAGLDIDSVYLYISSEANGPIVVDQDDPNGHCDTINPKLVPISMGGMPVSGKEALALKMQWIPVGGKGTIDFTDGTPDATYPKCDVFGKPMAAFPPPLCAMTGEASPITYVVPHPDPTCDNSAIWSIPPFTNAITDCEGYQVDTQNLIPEGPVCVAVVAKDKAGNVNVSPPLRLCLERSSGHCTGFPAAAANMKCTGKYDKVNDVVSTTTPCTPLVYAPSNYTTTFPPKQVVVVP